MIKEIIKDQFVLSQKSKPATKDDLYIIQDLLDTIQEHDNHWKRICCLSSVLFRTNLSKDIRRAISL